MFKKVLISDDLGSINKGVVSVLNNLSIKNVEQVQYCDDAYLKIKAAIAIKEEAPYDLLITDLSFKSDHREQKYTSGEALIKELRQENIDIKIIVYSIEDRLQRVRSLVKTHHINAYVCKGRKGLVELAEAINNVAANKLYLSPQVNEALTKKTNLDIDDYDIELVKQLANGLSQDEISTYFKTNSITPNSLSTIEKRLNKLRIQFKANNAIQLVAIMKDLGLI